ncbi:site-specific integrase [Nesterenkonia lutea]|uniref:Integrase n=1 Tax=Nesterenkonia lutea TaxID=272919 RepID=A0ABR9JGH5_9MICC|nr:site-specific integrase [Nesterenkonia lutea]MBE1525004.1 integrase [Nesterenkonia lutea]
MDDNLQRTQAGKPVRAKQYRARTYYRFSNGKNQQIEPWGTSRSRATAALKAAILTIEPDVGSELKPSTSLRALGQRFLVSKRDLGRSEGTLETYSYAVDAHISKKIGDLSIAEANPERLQRFLTRVEKESGPGAAKNCRSTLSGMMGLAVRNGAITHNPVRELERITQRKKKGSSAIPVGELPTFLEKVHADSSLLAWDTAELIDFMLSSGWRVAEVCALDVKSVNFAAGTATVEAINVRVKGQGVIRQAFPKTTKSGRTTPLPKPTMNLLRRRHERLKHETTLLFPTPLLRLRDPSNTQREVRDRRDLLGYPELSTHSFRKTVATILDKAGLSATDIADYLGHENPSMTQDVYMNTVKGAAEAARVMEKQLVGLI